MEWLWASENLHGMLARTKNVVRVGHLQRCVSSLEQKIHSQLQPVLVRGTCFLGNGRQEQFENKKIFDAIAWLNVVWVWVFQLSVGTRFVFFQDLIIFVPHHLQRLEF